MIELPQIEERDIYLSDDVNQVSLVGITQRIIEINQSDKKLKKIGKIYGFKYKPKPIKLFIDSYGGEVYPMMGLVGVIEQSKTPIHTIAIGAQMSCAFMILISGHKRFAYEHATPMYHQVSDDFKGTVKSIKENLKEGKRLQKWFENVVLLKTNITKKKLKNIFSKKKDYYMDCKEALCFGVIDEVIKIA
jgi:ATP-dependent Clp protease protease subunit